MKIEKVSNVLIRENILMRKLTLAKKEVKKPTKEDKKAKPKAAPKKEKPAKKAKPKKKDNYPADDGLVIIDDAIQEDKEAELEARKAYLEEARSQEVED